MKVVFWPVFVLLCGCSTMFPNNKRHATAAKDAVRDRTLFDLECTKVDVIQLGKTNRISHQTTSSQFGAKGCGKRVTYTTLCIANYGDISCTPRLDTPLRQ